MPTPDPSKLEESVRIAIVSDANLFDLAHPIRRTRVLVVEVGAVEYLARLRDGARKQREYDRLLLRSQHELNGRRDPALCERRHVEHVQPIRSQKPTASAVITEPGANLVRWIVADEMIDRTTLASTLGAGCVALGLHANVRRNH